jgi:hypothetical protein
MQMRDRYITAACRTADGIEWTILKIKPDGTELAGQDRMSMALSGDTAEAMLASAELPEALADQLKGDVTIPLRSAELLMRVADLPTTDAAEIANMVGFQIDKISPFPSDQLAVSHEVLHQTEGHSLVLMAAAKRPCIDAIGDFFEAKGVRVHSIDARVLGWLQLLADAGHVPGTGCEIFIIDDDIDFTLVVVCDGAPLALRSLHANPEDPGAAGDLAYEIGYALATLDTEREMPAPAAIQYWSGTGLPATLRANLEEKSSLPLHSHDLGTLPPLSEGIVRRAQKPGGHVELIPREWIDHENRKQLNRKTIRAAAAVAAAWLVVLLAFFSIYKFRDLQLSKVKQRADAIAPAAEQALENRQKLRALKTYTDRSSSALECLREATRMLPVGDIEFYSYNYNKEKGISLRGSASNYDIVNRFFETLTTSKLFEQLKDDKVKTNTSKGVRREEFSATLVLPATEEGP